MVRKFTHITPEHREAIASLLKVGISKDKIAKQLKAKTVVNRAPL